jgi:putative ABC transport system permease protein
MIRHLLKLAWNRKRAHGLLIFEILISFLVVFGVAALGRHFGGNALRPLGFDGANVWIVEIGRDWDWQDGALQARQAETFRTLLREVRELPEVVAAAGASAVPYDGSTTTGVRELRDGASVEFHMSVVTDGFFDALGVPFVAGRAFVAADEALAHTSAVIDRDAARALFGDADPLGQRPPFATQAEGDPELRIVGVVDDYRKDGELSGPTNFVFLHMDPAALGPDSFDKLVLRLSAPPPSGFEEELLRRLRALAPDWSFDMHPLAALREKRLRAAVAPLVSLGVIALFLLLMVALGLVGVMWQNVTQRTREIGLRRASGASAGAIRRQVVGEMLLLAGFGVVLGAAIVAQLPILGWFAGLDAATLVESFAFSAALIAGLTLLCGVYPSRLATAIHPAEALHHE